MLRKNNHVGKSNNIEMKKRKINKIYIIVASIILVSIIVVLISIGSLSNLIGDSVTNQFYCEDSSYKLDGDKCVKEIKTKAAVLGDVNLDEKIDEQDVKLITDYVDYIFYEEGENNLSDYQIKLADINQDGEVYYVDETILKEYLDGTISTYGIYQENIGVSRFCEDGYTLNNDYCIKKDSKQALLKKINNDNDNNIDKVTIEYNGNGGTGIMQTSISSSNKIKLSKNSFINGNKIFVGWNVYSKKQQKWLYYADDQNNSYIFLQSNENNKVQFYDEEIIETIPLVKNDSLVFYAQWFDNESDKIYFSSDYWYNQIVKKGQIFHLEGALANYSKDNIQVYYKMGVYEYGNPVQQIECKRMIAHNRTVDLGNIQANEYTQAKIQLYLDSKCTKKYGKEYETGIFKSSNSIPIEVSFDDKKDTYYKKDSKISVGINFNVKDISQSYYYKVENYLYGDIDNRYKSGCKKIEGSKTSYDINIDGNRNLKVNIFYDDKCSMRMTDKIFKSPKYKCDNCTNAVQTLFNIYFDGEKNSKFNMDIDFSLADKEEEYYYIISNFLNGKLDNSTKCTKVTDGPVENSFVLNGQRETKLTIYNDSLCKSKYKEESSGKIIYKNFDKYSATIEPVKAITTNIQNGNKSTDNKIATKKVISNNTNLYLKLNFNINDNSRDYYYHIDTHAYYNFEGLIYKGVNIDYSSKSSNCFKVPKSGNATKIMNIVIPNSGYNLPSTSFSSIDDIKKNSNIIKYQVKLYDNEKCSGISLKNINESKSSVSYRLQTFNVSYDANGGVAKVSKAAIPQMNGNILTYNYSNVLTLFYNYKNKRIIPSGSSEVYKIGGYDLMGYKVKNSKGKYMCYINEQKNSKGYTDVNICKKYGYVIYTDDNILSRTSGVDGETISFIAQWSNNPVNK